MGFSKERKRWRSEGREKKYERGEEKWVRWECGRSHIKMQLQPLLYFSETE
jgi:hypothetical protein